MEKGLSNEERWSEMDLLRRLRNKELGAYRELIDRYYRFVYMIAYELHRDERMADQYVLELFAHIWNDSEDVCGEEMIRQYFFRLIYEKYQRYMGVLAEMV
jgi:DNA-directed RNA polymerase specialized sigma24 family protein